ncbi:MAG: hypothetical protein ACRCY4_00935 [Brevinema sp.]
MSFNRSLLYVFLIITPVTSQAVNPSSIRSPEPSNYLKNRAPFFLKNPNSAYEKEVPIINEYTITIEDAEESSSAFRKLTGLSPINAAFTASWYVFDSPSRIPQSVVEIQNLVNRRKPAYFSQLVRKGEALNGWAELSYTTLDEKTMVVVYISLVTSSGALVPVASQMFYRDSLTQRYQRDQTTHLNLDLVRFWLDRGYFN